MRGSRKNNLKGQEDCLRRGWGGGGPVCKVRGGWVKKGVGGGGGGLFANLRWVW